MKITFLIILTFFFHTVLTFGSAPIPFSGKLSLNNQNFEGSAKFSFSIVDHNGTEHWRHAQNPDETLESYVSQGRYLILLGGQGMQPIPAELFLNHPNLFLRVTVDLLDGQGSRTLIPDQAITSSPYALAAELARLAERAAIADGVPDGAISHNMLSEEILADLNRTIQHSNLSPDIRDELGRIINLPDLSAEVIEELNDTVGIGSITHEQLSEEILADLNRTIHYSDLSSEILDELGRTINLSDLSENVIAELNDTVGYGSITHELLSGEVLADLNRTIHYSDLSSEIHDELGRTINLSDLSENVIAELNDTVGIGSITHEQLSGEVLADLNRTIERSQLASDIVADLNRTITLSMLGEDVLNEINSSSLSSGSISSGYLDPNLTRYFLPEITSVSSSLSILQGDSTSLSVQAQGKFMTYQWYRNGVAVQGATQSTLSLQDLNASLNEGNYTLVISNDWGSITSQPVALSIATALPTITLNGAMNITHEAGTPYTDAGAYASDALGSDINGSIVVTGADVNVSSVGQQTVTYSVTDAGGNQNSITRTVSVVDTTNPSIYLSGGTSFTHALNSAWSDPGYEANDSVDGNLTSNVLISGSVDVNTSGTYSLVYSVSDAAGNESNITRTVSVQLSGPWTFTNAGATGRNGPTLSQIVSEYSSTLLENAVTINTQGIQEWTIPSNGTYKIEAWGASGGEGDDPQNNTRPGNGARMSGHFTLTGNHVLKILVGQQGGTGTYSSSKAGGGGGGSFVYNTSTNLPLIVAAGGNGENWGSWTTNGPDGQATNNGTTSGGAVGGRGGGGGGLSSNGANYSGSMGGQSFTNGGVGGLRYSSEFADGGFGGGGGSRYEGGGGGGYHGGKLLKQINTLLIILIMVLVPITQETTKIIQRV